MPAAYLVQGRKFSPNATSTHLPDFDQAVLDQHFLAELERLHQAGAFTSFRELADILDVRTSIVKDIDSGRAHCTLKLLYTVVQYYPMADVQRIVFGSAGVPSKGLT